MTAAIIVASIVAVIAISILTHEIIAWRRRKILAPLLKPPAPQQQPQQ